MIVSKGNAVELARSAKGWNLSRLAKEAGICNATSGKLEKGEPITPETAKKVSEALEKPFEQLFDIVRK